MGVRAVFFDRDGTLNVDIGYLHKKEDFVWIEGAVDAIKKVNDSGALAIVVTNQSGIARGYYPETDVLRLHDWMNEELAKHGAHIDAFYYCPYHVDGTVERYAVDSDLRKPRAGMVLQAMKEHDIDPTVSCLIGDSESDILCAKNAGIQGILYTGGSLANYIDS